MIGQRQQIPRFQSTLYRDSYYKILRAFFVSIGIILLLILGILYLILLPASPRYFASTTTGQLIELTAFH